MGEGTEGGLSVPPPPSLSPSGCGLVRCPLGTIPVSGFPEGSDPTLTTQNLKQRPTLSPRRDLKPLFPGTRAAWTAVTQAGVTFLKVANR